MRAVRLILGVIVAVTACSERPDEERATTPNQPVAPGPEAAAAQTSAATDPTRVPAELVAPGELLGEWRIAGVDGREMGGDYAVTASITKDRIHVVADCINIAWSYAAESGSISTRRVPVEGCGRGMSAQEEALVAAIDGATGFGRVPSNAIEIFNRAHRVTLFSQ